MENFTWDAKAFRSVFVPGGLPQIAMGSGRAHPVHDPTSLTGPGFPKSDDIE
jgi:hypothetical protein